MIIALAGAGGTGKGTLGEMLSKHFKLPFLPSHIKPTGITMGLEKNYGDTEDKAMDLAFQYAILMGQVYQQRATMEIHNGCIMERTTFDFIPYFLDRGLGKYEEKYLEIARTWGAKAYDVVIYTPLEFVAKDTIENAWKERNYKRQQRTDQMILEELYRHCPSKVISVTGSPEDRFEQVLNKLSERRLKIC